MNSPNEDEKGRSSESPEHDSSSFLCSRREGRLLLGLDLCRRGGGRLDGSSPSKLVGELLGPCEGVPSSHRLVVEVVSGEIDEEGCVGYHDDHLRGKKEWKSAIVLDASRFRSRRYERISTDLNDDSSDDDSCCKSESRVSSQTRRRGAEWIVNRPPAFASA